MHASEPHSGQARDIHRTAFSERALAVGVDPFVKLATSHESARHVGRLQSRALSRRVSGEVARDGHQDVASLRTIAPFAKLANAGLQHLISMKPCILAQERIGESADQRFAWVAEQQVPGDQPSGLIYLTLAIE